MILLLVSIAYGSLWRSRVDDHNHEKLVTESHGILFAR
jgi:hypothetical protein